MSEHPLPKDTGNVLSRSRIKHSNFALYFQRMLEGWGSTLQNWTTANAYDVERHIIGPAKTIFTQENSSDLLRALHARQEYFLKRFRDRRGQKTTCEAKGAVIWRLLTGLATPSLLDNGITLHRVYGFPMLPGSAVKGLLRNYRLEQIAGLLDVVPLHPEKMKDRHGPTPWQNLETLLLMPDPSDKEEKTQMKEMYDRLRSDADLGEGELKKGSISLDRLRNDETYGAAPFRRAFGSTKEQGEVIFLDAYPQELVKEGVPILEAELINPHYGDYYTKGGIPSDDQNPIPVPMIAVRAGTSFSFRMACQDADLLQNHVGPWLRNALSDWGVGAKTRSGYGELDVE